MRRLVLVFLIGIVVAFGSVGKVTALKGSAFIERINKKLQVNIGIEIEKKDVIVTDKDSKLQVVFNDDTVITVGRKSRFVVDDYLFEGTGEPKADFRLVKGIMKNITGKIGKIAPDRFKVKTKNATIGIRGTIFVVQTNQRITRVGMLEGRVTFKDMLTSKTYEVKKGQELIFDSNNPKNVIIKEGYQEPEDVKMKGGKKEEEKGGEKKKEKKEKKKEGKKGEKKGKKEGKGSKKDMKKGEKKEKKSGKEGEKKEEKKETKGKGSKKEAGSKSEKKGEKTSRTEKKE